jgi:hypothetical protein
VADLVLSDAALQSLKAVLSGALADLEAVQRALGKANPAAVGADAVVDAESSYAAGRAADLTVVGVGISVLKDQVDKVGQRIGDTDQQLGSNSPHFK